MSRPILSRPRTRVYGCNYDKGESYYKPMVDHLDRKYSARPLFAEPRNTFADEIAARRSDIGTRDLSGPRSGSSGRDLDLEFEPRTRASHLPSQSSPLATSDLFPDDEDMVYDSRGQRTRRRFADDFADEVSASTRRFKARIAAMGLEEDVEANGTRSRFEQDVLESGLAARRKMQAAKSAIEEADSDFKRRSKLLAEEVERLDENRPALTRWSKLIGEEDEPLVVSAAATRAKQTKARLNDLETEMEEMAARQAKRERRAAALRALVNETSNEDQLVQSAVSKKVSVRSSERSEKHVSF